jgi:hypothetical protein
MPLPVTGQGTTEQERRRTQSNATHNGMPALGHPYGVYAPSRRGPVAAVGFPLACIHRFRLRARVGVTVAAPSPPLTDPSERN